MNGDHRGGLSSMPDVRYANTQTYNKNTFKYDIKSNIKLHRFDSIDSSQQIFRRSVGLKGPFIHRLFIMSMAEIYIVYQTFRLSIDSNIFGFEIFEQLFRYTKTFA